MTTALINIDMQNGYLEPDGSLARAGRALLEPEAMLREDIALLEEARRRGMPVIHTAHVHRPGYLDASPFVRELFAPVDGIIAGTADGEFVEAVAPREGEPVVFKNRYDAFLYTDLEVLLRALRVDRIVIAGLVTHGCVESTARAADMRDFDVTVAVDAVTTMPQFHEASLTSMSGVGIRQMPWREALDAVAGPADRAAAASG